MVSVCGSVTDAGATASLFRIATSRCRCTFADRAVQRENKPSQYDPNGPPPPQFRIVHAVQISKAGLVYVCDRTNDRFQVFRDPEGTNQQIYVLDRTTLQVVSAVGAPASTGPASTPQ